MREKISYLVVDTCVLVKGIVEGQKGPVSIVDLLENGNYKIGLTNAIFNEYVNVFSRPETLAHVPIDHSHLLRLNKILEAAHSLNSKNYTGRLSNLQSNIYTEKINNDYKFIIAADIVVGETQKPGVLISEDTDITSLRSELAKARILAMTSYAFLETFLPKYPH